MQELEQFKTECPGLPNVMAADSLIRKKIRRLQSEQRELYNKFETALWEVLNYHKYLWNDARAKAVLAKVDRIKTETSDEQDRVLESPVKTSAPSNRKSRRKKNKAQGDKVRKKTE